MIMTITCHPCSNVAQKVTIYVCVVDVRDKKKILAIGFLPPPIGGVSISFELFVITAKKRNDIELNVLNLSAISLSRRRFLDSVKLFLKLVKYISNNDVITLYCATSQVATIGLATWIICKFKNRPLVLRKAAGRDHIDSGYLRGMMGEFVARRVDLFLVQTKELLKICKMRNFKQVEWYPTNRLVGPKVPFKKQCRRFVFIGHVRLVKGIEELINVSGKLPKTVSVDVYGPFYDNLNERIFDNTSISYKGVLEPENVVSTMLNYDVFVLPTKAESEGYPGAILEAISAGLPVISTHIGGIPEIVDSHIGILVPPGDEASLLDAMVRLVKSDEAYQTFQRSISRSRNKFSTEYWTDWLIDKCMLL